MKNKRDRLFFTLLFVPQAPQSSYDRRAELEVLLAIPSAQDACGMEIRMEENEGKEKKQKKKMQPKRWLAGFLGIFLAGLAGWLVFGGKFNAGQLVEYIGYFESIVWPIMAISMLIEKTSRGKASLNRITELMDAPVDVTDRDGVGNLENPKGSIEFRHLTFRYPDGDYNVLQDVSFQVAAGESVGIVGKTGAGKTTVVDLLLRTYNVPDGTLFVDGKDVNSVSIHSVRNACAYVPQDNFLFSDTIAHNIGFGVDDATFDQINGAASLADVRDNIVDFKEGYETILGERGVTVSGGQKQRISIARALLKNAPILILDDSVSAVDTRTEKIILDNLKTTRAGKTTLLIAHRISTVEGMDKIVFLEDGRVEAVGTHDALYHSCPEYRRMVDLQRLEDETADSSDAVGTSDIADSVDAPEHAPESVEKCEGGASHD